MCSAQHVKEAFNRLNVPALGGESPAGRVRILGSAKSSMSRHLSPDHRPVKIIDNTCKVGLRWSGEISKIRDRLKQTNPSPL